MDRIRIRDIELQAIIGTKPVERTTKQRVLIQLDLETDMTRAALSDRIEDAVNYKDIKDRVVALVEQSRFHLVERMAEAIAGLCLADRRVARVTVGVDKPDALTGARSVGVEVTRDQSSHGTME
jgi:FolB domain-containing protein